MFFALVHCERHQPNSTEIIGANETDEAAIRHRPKQSERVRWEHFSIVNYSAMQSKQTQRKNSRRTQMISIHKATNGRNAQKTNRLRLQSKQQKENDQHKKWFCFSRSLNSTLFAYSIMATSFWQSINLNLATTGPTFFSQIVKFVDLLLFWPQNHIRFEAPQVRMLCKKIKDEKSVFIRHKVWSKMNCRINGKNA